MRSKLTRALAVLAMVAALLTGALASSSPAGAQGTYPGSVGPCIGTAGGWIAVYGGAVNCSRQNHYDSSTGKVAYRQYLMDLHGPSSNGSACTYNINCLNGVVECFASGGVREPVWTDMGSNTSFRIGDTSLDANYYNLTAWFKGTAPFASYMYGGGSGAVSRILSGPMTGPGTHRVYAPPAYLVPVLPGSNSWVAQYDNSPSGMDDLECIFNYRGKVPAGRTFQAGASWESNLQSYPGHGNQRNILDSYLWVHCNWC